jgi:Phosphoesterase family
VPPVIDGEGYGFRVPGLVISPYARPGCIDRRQLSHDACLKFIEDDFLEGRRLNPATDGRPDSRPGVREEASGLGNLLSDFDFCQSPRAPLILPTHPEPGPASSPPGSAPTVPAQPEPGPCPPPEAPPKAAPPPPAPVLALTASVAGRQNMRRNRGRIYLTVGCNMSCGIYAHGHLGLARRRRRLRLRSATATLAANHAVCITLYISRSEGAALRAALRAGRRVEALIDVDATAAGEASKSYLVHVQLSCR